jgi:hypothetical protein
MPQRRKILMALLLIYDGDDKHIAAGAARRTDDEAIVRLGITNKGSNLLSSLDAFVSISQTFNRILFDTHGLPGRVYFGNKSFDANWIRSNMAGRNYDAICPSYTSIYFNGCNVAEGEAGSNFLRTIASIFLLRAGGKVFGHTSKGLYTRWGLYPKTFHLWGDVKTIFVEPGGKVSEEFSQ